jgi:hypothetical protein
MLTTTPIGSAGRAEECPEQAVNAISPLDEEAWLRVAQEWLKLALSADARRP